MKNFTKIFLVFMIMLSASSFAQTKISGTVMDGEFNEPLPGANLYIKGTQVGTTTDLDGKFEITTTEKSGIIIVSFLGFESKSVAFSATTNTVDLGQIQLTPDASQLTEVVLVGKGIVDLAADRKTPIAVSTITASEIQAKATGNVEFVEAIKNTPSVYVSNQAGGFGDSQVFLRGFDQTNTAFLLNGQPINGMEDGRMYWSNWSGMSDIANVVQVQRGLGSSKLAISSVGGTINIVTKSTDKKEGGFARTMVGNDSYLKGTVNYNTGLSSKGWAFSILLDHWQAHRKFAEGTAGQGQNYMFAVGYKPNDKHAFNLLLTGAPQWHDQNFSKPLEDYERFGDKYNSNSGFLNGERYSERRNYYHKPVANLNWDFNINDKTELSTVLYASWGRGGGTGPLGGADKVTNEVTGSINFDQIQLNNIANNNAAGLGTFGNSYIMRSSVNNHNWYGVLSNLNYEISETLSFNIGVDGRTYTGDHFRQITDFLGKTGYNDNFRTDRPSNYVINQSFEANPWAALFDFADEGQRYDRDYSETINYVGGFGQLEFQKGGFSAFIQGALSTQSYQREGRMIGTGDGLGKSDKVEKVGYNLKGGLGYSINENHTFFANAGFYSRQPFLDNIFANILYSNELVSPDVDNEEITGFEGGYRFKNEKIKLNIDVYWTKWANRFISTAGPRIGIAPEPIQTSTYRYTDVTQFHRGAEFDLQYKATDYLRLKSFGSFGKWTYDDATPYTLQNDETGEFLVTNGNADLTDVKVGNAPQTSVGFGVNVRPFKGFTFDLDYNVYSDLYEFVDAEDVADEGRNGNKYQAIRLPSYDLMDASFSYKFNFGKNDFIVRGNVYNLWNEQYIGQTDAFGSFLGLGRTYNFSLQYTF